MVARHISFFQILDLVEVMKTDWKSVFPVTVTIYDVKLNCLMKKVFNMKTHKIHMVGFAGLVYIRSVLNLSNSNLD